MEQWTDGNWQRRSEAVYKCQLSALYHRKLERHFSMLDKCGTALALIAGSAAFSDLLPSAGAKAWAGAVVAAATLPSLVFGWSDKSRSHALMASRFVRIEAEIEAAGVVEAAALDDIHGRLLGLEAEEPPQLSALTRLCQNELAIALDAPANITPMPWWQRKLCYFFDMPLAIPAARSAKSQA